jgi:hypothetical protein
LDYVLKFNATMADVEAKGAAVEQQQSEVKQVRAELQATLDQLYLSPNDQAASAAAAQSTARRQAVEAALQTAQRDLRAVLVDAEKQGLFVKQLSLAFKFPLPSSFKALLKLVPRLAQQAAPTRTSQPIAKATVEAPKHPRTGQQDKKDSSSAQPAAAAPAAAAPAAQQQKKKDSASAKPATTPTAEPAAAQKQQSDTSAPVQPASEPAFAPAAAKQQQPAASVPAAPAAAPTAAEMQRPDAEGRAARAALISQLRARPGPASAPTSGTQQDVAASAGSPPPELCASFDPIFKEHYQPEQENAPE